MKNLCGPKVALLSILFLLPTGCTPAPPNAPHATASQSATKAPTDSATSQASVSNISEKEALDYAEGFTKQLLDKNYPAIQQAFDYDKFLSFLMADLGLPTEALDGIKQGFDKRLKETPGGFFRDFCGQRVKVMQLSLIHI